MKSGFLDKLMDRLDLVDPKSLQSQFLNLAQDRGLLETIFQSLQEGVVVVSGDGGLRYANAAAENLLGFKMASSSGAPIQKYIRDLDWHEILSCDESDSQKLTLHEIEITYPEHRYVNFYLVHLSDVAANEPGAVIILRDVTHARKEEANVLESERINAVKLLAAGVAHEIGNPLNALNIHLQLLNREVDQLSEADPAELKELVEIACTEVSRLDLVITQFLRAIRPSRPDFVNRNPLDVLTSTLALLKQEIQNRSIDVVVDCPSELPDVPLDENQIKQAFFNIIRNAFQAMPDGGSLAISVSVTDEFVKLTFSDTGVGIKPEDFGRIFEPYHTSKTEGSGLGLMIVQRVVQDHGGQIEVSSRPDEGTSFIISLPRAERRIRLLDSRK